MTVAGTTVELEFSNIVAETPFVVAIQTRGQLDEIMLEYGAARLLADQGVDYDVLVAGDLLSFTITPHTALLDKIAINGPNTVYVFRQSLLTTDFDNDDAFVRDKLVTEFNRVWMKMQELDLETGDVDAIIADLEALVVVAQDAATAAAASEAAAELAETNAETAETNAETAETNAEAAAAAAAASAASLTYATNAEMLTGTATNRMANPDNVAALWEFGGNVAAATTLVLGDGGYFGITGTGASITDIDFTVDRFGRRAWLNFGSAGNTLVHNATSLHIPGGANYVTQANDWIEIISMGGDNIKVLSIVHNDGTPLFISSPTSVLTGINTLQTVTPDTLAALWERGPDIAAAATTVLTEGGYFVITGNTGISAMTFAVATPGRRAWVYFGGTPLLTHGANFQLPSSANIQVVAGDKMLLVHLGATTYRVIDYVRDSGKALVPPTAGEINFGGGGNLSAGLVSNALLELDREKISFRNRIINGDFAIDQRGGGTAQAVGAGAGVIYTLDRWYGYSAQAPGAWTMQQVAEDPTTGRAGEYQLVVTPTAADASLAASDVYTIGHKIEGHFCRGLNWGSSQAKSVTVSFDAWVSGTPVTLVLSLHNNANNRSWLGSFAVTTTRTRFTFTIPGDTTGTWEQGVNTGINVTIALGAGSSLQGVAGWQAGNLVTLAGASNMMAGGTNLQLANFQLELGLTATDFEQVPYDQQLRRCLRYFYRKYAAVAAERIATGYAFGANQTANTLRLPVRMRAIPTLLTNSLQANGQDSTGSAASGASEDALGFNVSVAAGIAAGDGVGITLKTAGTSLIEASAEL